MSKCAKNIVRISSVLGVLLSLTTLGMTKASALELPGLPISLPLGKLLERGLELEPKLMDNSVNRNNVQLCLPLCSLGVPTNTLSSPQGPRPQPQLQNVPSDSRFGSGQNIPSRRLPSPQ